MTMTTRWVSAQSGTPVTKAFAKEYVQSVVGHPDGVEVVLE